MAKGIEELEGQVLLQHTITCDTAERGEGISSARTPVLALRNRDVDGTSPQATPQPVTTSRSQAGRSAGQHNLSASPPISGPAPVIPEWQRFFGSSTSSANHPPVDAFSNKPPPQPMRRDSIPPTGPVTHQPVTPAKQNIGLPQPLAQPYSNTPIIPSYPLLPRSYSHSGPPANAPYYRILPGAPQVYASPAPLSTYIPSPAPQLATTWHLSAQSPAINPGYPAIAAPNRPQITAASFARLPGIEPSAQPATRPFSSASIGTPQHISGDPAQPYASQGTPAPTQTALTPGKFPTRRATGVFIANDPFEAFPRKKHSKKSDGMTFDDIPVAGQLASESAPSTPYRPLLTPVPYYGTPAWRAAPDWQHPANQPPVSQPQDASSGGHTGYPMTQAPFNADEGKIPSSENTPPTHSPVFPESSISTPAESSERPRPQSPSQRVGILQSNGQDTLVPVAPVFPARECRNGEDVGHISGDTNSSSMPDRPISPVIRYPTQDSSEYYNPSTPYYPAMDSAFPSSPNSDQPHNSYPPSERSFWSEVGNLLSSPFVRSKPYEPPMPHLPYGQSAQGLSEGSEKGIVPVVLAFIVGTLPSQVYLHFLLRLPSLYFSRVARIFEEADLTLPEIKKMALQTASQGKANLLDFQLFEVQNVPPQYERLKSTWEAFIDSVMREWETCNIISVLLLSAILTILQIDSAASDPITRYTALFSLICGLMGLLFGCMYIIRFGSMRKTYRAAEWALEAKSTKTIWWNVWVLLAMPVIWLTWSIVLYIACIMSFVWRTTPSDHGSNASVSNKTILFLRLVISAVLGLGVIYGWLIVNTFRRYGTVMDKAWEKRIDSWIKEKSLEQSASHSYPTPYYDPALYRPQDSSSAPYSSYESIPGIPANDSAYDIRIEPPSAPPSPSDSLENDFQSLSPFTVLSDT